MSKIKSRTLDAQTGQAMLETLLVIIILTAIGFAALQLCIMVVNDMICNEAAFASVRSAVVSKHSDASSHTDQIARLLLLPHFLTQKDILYEETKLWDSTILGEEMLDHSDATIKKYNANIRYRMRLSFASLIKPSLLNSGYVSHTARARMIKSPDESFYFKAFPEADNFTDPGDE
jgi:hypothetical protein